MNYSQRFGEVIPTEPFRPILNFQPIVICQKLLAYGFAVNLYQVQGMHTIPVNIELQFLYSDAVSFGEHSQLNLFGSVRLT